MRRLPEVVREQRFSQQAQAVWVRERAAVCVRALPLPREAQGDAHEPSRREAHQPVTIYDSLFRTANGTATPVPEFTRTSSRWRDTRLTSAEKCRSSTALTANTNPNWKEIWTDTSRLSIWTYWIQQNIQGDWPCDTCHRVYKRKHALVSHKKYECGKEPQFQCPHCLYKAKLKGTLKAHIAIKHLRI